MPNRRQVLAGLGTIGLGAAGLALAGGHSALAAPLPPPGLGEWTGDSFEVMHAIRDGGFENRPLPEPHRRVEVCIVGGGLTGLAVAHQLRDMDLLLLEREAALGGNAKSGSWRGIDYALGSAYLVDLEKPFGDFYDSLGAMPAPVASPAERVLDGDDGMADALAGPLRDPFARLRRHMAEIIASEDFPGIPVHKASARALALDHRSFLDYLRGQEVPPALLKLVDAYCHSSLGGGIEVVSAYAGINFYSEIAQTIHAFPGGNAVLARAMAARVEAAGKGRMTRDAAVFAIEPDHQGLARIAYVDTRSGENRAIAARHVVVATPFFLAGRIIRGLDPAVAAVMKGLIHSSFLVANCCFTGRRLSDVFDTWTPSNPAFTDFVAAGSILPRRTRPADRDVLTVYAPFRDAPLGRRLLLEGDRAALAETVVAGLKRFAPDVFSGSKLEEVRLTRYGHQHLSSRMGLVEIMRRLPRRTGPVILAHSDGQAMASVESAITEALRAARMVRGR